MEQELSSACRAAADALEVLSHLRPGFTRNVVPRLNSTSVSPRQANNGERLTVNSEEPGERQTINEESAVQSTSSPVFTNSSIQTRRTTLFPTLGSSRANRKSGISRRTARPKQPITSTRGWPSIDSRLQGSCYHSKSQDKQSAYSQNPSKFRRKRSCLPRVSF